MLQITTNAAQPLYYIQPTKTATPDVGRSDFHPTICSQTLLFPKKVGKK